MGSIGRAKMGDAAHKWIPPGSLYTCGPESYKIPSLNDVPFKFSVSLLKVKHNMPHQKCFGCSIAMDYISTHYRHGYGWNEKL